MIKGKAGISLTPVPFPEATGQAERTEYTEKNNKNLSDLCGLCERKMRVSQMLRKNMGSTLLKLKFYGKTRIV